MRGRTGGTLRTAESQDSRAQGPAFRGGPARASTRREQPSLPSSVPGRMAVSPGLSKSPRVPVAHLQPDSEKLTQTPQVGLTSLAFPPTVVAAAKQEGELGPFHLENPIPDPPSNVGLEA